MKYLIIIFLLSTMFIQNAFAKDLIDKNILIEKLIEQSTNKKKDTTDLQNKCLSKLVSNASYEQNVDGSSNYYVRIENYNQELVFGNIYLFVNKSLHQKKSFMVYSNEFTNLAFYNLKLVSRANAEIKIGCNIK